jgi:hypothetical protein
MAGASKSFHTTDELESGALSYTLVDETGAAVALASITAMLMTLYDEKTGAIINSRNAQDVLNTNQCTFHATTGAFAWAPLPADMAMSSGSTQATERHIAQIRTTWTSGTKAHTHLAYFTVGNIVKLP